MAKSYANYAILGLFRFINILYTVT